MEPRLRGHEQIPRGRVPGNTGRTPMQAPESYARGSAGHANKNTRATKWHVLVGMGAVARTHRRLWRGVESLYSRSALAASKILSSSSRFDSRSSSDSRTRSWAGLRRARAVVRLTGPQRMAGAGAPDSVARSRVQQPTRTAARSVSVGPKRQWTVRCIGAARIDLPVVRHFGSRPPCRSATRPRTYFFYVAFFFTVYSRKSERMTSGRPVELEVRAAQPRARRTRGEKSTG